MKKITLLLSPILFFIGVHKNLVAQTQSVNYTVPFASSKQNMWGPSFNAFSLNTTVDLFSVPWNESFSLGGTTTILNSTFGVEFNGGFSGVIGSRFSLTGFTSGEVEVDYPVDIEVLMPQDLTYDQGDEIEIQTNYDVLPGHKLESYYPSLGEIKFDVFFRFAAELNAKICVFGCAAFPIIPSFDTGLKNINVFTVNENGADFFSFDGGSPLQSYPGLPLESSSISGDPLGNYGISATIDLPYVETTYDLNGDDLSACGQDPYVNLNLDVFGLISGLNIPYVSQIAEIMSGSVDLGAGPVSAEIYWTLFGAEFDVNMHNKQCFDFKPKVWGKFDFPTPVTYSVYTPSNALVESGESSIINVQIGNKVQYKFPCYYEDVIVKPTFSIDGQFTNHTYDSISFDFNMEVFKFGVKIPKVVILPAIHIPRFCFRIGYPCGFISWCRKTICTPEINIPEVAWSGIDASFGPLWSTSIPLTSIKYDWFKQTWALEGFDTYEETPFVMRANRLSVFHNQTDVACYGDATGAVEITPYAVSPALPYTYLWTNGEVTQNLSNIEAGSYQVQIEDANGCKQFTGVVINQPIQPIQIEYSAIDKKCNGGANDGQIDLNVLGGTSPYSYNWSNGAPNSSSINNLDIGIYTVEVEDDYGCTENIEIAIDMPLSLQQTAIVDDVLCTNDLTGSIEAIPSGGVFSYTYSWSNGETTRIINNISAGSYTLTLTDANNCESVETYTVNEPAQALHLEANVTDVLCKNDKTGSIHVTVNGGTPNYTYQWRDENQILPIYQEDLSNYPDGIYRLKVTDENGCTDEIIRTISEPAQELVDNPILQHIDCYGETTGEIDPAIFGGTMSYTYNWSNGTHNPTLENVAAGTYSLQVRDDNNCVADFNYELTQPDAPLSLSIEKIDVSCYGGSDGKITAVVSGGTAPYTYVWNNGSNDALIESLSAGYYELTVTDANNCVISMGSNIEQPTEPLLVIDNVTDVDCYGNFTGKITLSTTGGTAPYSYRWTDDNSYILTENVDSIVNKSKGVYTVTVTDVNHCTYELVTAIDQPNSPLDLQYSQENVSCYGGTDGEIDIEVIGGTLPYSYQWSNGSLFEDLTTISAGGYTVTVTDENGCQHEEIITINQPEEPLILSIQSQSSSCFNVSDGAAYSFVSGGTQPYTFEWSNGATTKDIINVLAGVYSLTVTDANGCTSFSGTQIEEHNELIVNAIPNDVTCYDYNNGSIEITIEGGYPPYTYNWGDTSRVLLNHFYETIENLGEGDYLLRIEDKNGCKNEQIVQINQPDSLIITSTIHDVLCYADSTGLIEVTPTGATAPYTYEWSDGQTTSTAIELWSSDHQLTITDSQGCDYLFNFFVPQPEELRLAYNVTPLSCKDQSDAMITVQAFGGIQPYHYWWSVGSTGVEVSDLGKGEYQLTVQDDNLCENIHTFYIEESTVVCIDVPNTITPNGDNYNDTWVIDDIDLYPNAAVRIFNKWGNLVYESIGNYTPWDGTDNGRPLPSEVYYYIIDLGTSDGESYTGTITIIR